MSRMRICLVLGAALMLLGCSGCASGGGLSLFDSTPPIPAAAPIELDSEPQGAQAKTSLGPSCQTPCSLQVPTGAPFSVTFSQDGYAPQTVPVQIQPGEDGAVKFTPNPVYAELGPTPGGKKKKKTSAKPPSPTTAAAAPAPATTPR
jgi:hypothetical protein